MTSAALWNGRKYLSYNIRLVVQKREQMLSTINKISDRFLSEKKNRIERIKKEEREREKNEGRRKKKKKLMTCQSQASAVVPRNYLELIWLVLCVLGRAQYKWAIKVHRRVPPSSLLSSRTWDKWAPTSTSVLIDPCAAVPQLFSRVLLRFLLLLSFFSRQYNAQKKKGILLPIPAACVHS